MAQPLCIDEVSFASAQGFFGALLFRHVHRGADVFSDLSVFTENRMADRMDVLDGSIGQHDPVLMLVLHVSKPCLLQQFIGAVVILRVDSLPECLSGWHTLLRV